MTLGGAEFRQTAAASTKADGEHCHTGAGDLEVGEHGDHPHER